MRVGDVLSWGIVAAIGYWGVSVVITSPPERPAATCSPVVRIADGVRHGLAAIQPGSGFEIAGTALREHVARWCASYAVNLFEANRASQPAGVGPGAGALPPTATKDLRP